MTTQRQRCPYDDQPCTCDGEADDAALAERITAGLLTLRLLLTLVIVSGLLALLAL